MRRDLALQTMMCNLRPRLWSVLFLLIVSSQQCFSQISDRECCLSIKRGNYGLGSLRVGASPALNLSSLEEGALAVGATAVVYPYDEEIQEWVQENRTPGKDRLAASVKNFGDFSYMLSRLGAVYVVGSVLNSDKLRRTGAYSIESGIVAGFFTQAIKYTVRRTRPGRPTSDDPWDLPRSNLSFPSGHATVAFATATVISSQYGDNDLIRWSAYLLATLTGWSRVNDNDHWASDVIFGAYVGYASAKIITDVVEDDDDPGLSMLTTEVPVLTLSFTF